jgi:hypothetical protein
MREEFNKEYQGRDDEHYIELTKLQKIIEE